MCDEAFWHQHDRGIYRSRVRVTQPRNVGRTHTVSVGRETQGAVEDPDINLSDDTDVVFRL